VIFRVYVFLPEGKWDKMGGVTLGGKFDGNPGTSNLMFLRAFCQRHLSQIANVKQPKKTRVEIEMPWLLHIEMLDSSLPKLLPSQHCQGKASLWPSPSARE